ncbi:MAG: DUF4389 domain-containing protein [Dehalococcoidia bacterium]|nr:DUF4389 domain-containing protein [Dehalococcoidia bacterium]
MTTPPSSNDPAEEPDASAGEPPAQQPWSWEPALGDPAPPPPPEPPPVESGAEMLARLRERGLISQEEYEERRGGGPSATPPLLPPAAPDSPPPPLQTALPPSWAPPPPPNTAPADGPQPSTPKWVPPPRERYPMEFEVEYPEHLSRWTTLIRGITVIPLLVLLPLFQYFAQFALMIGFTAVFWRRKYPGWLFSGLSGSFAYAARSHSYWLLLTDRFPSFSKEESPVTLNFDEPPSGHLSRWRVLLWKSILLIPHWIVLSFLGIAVVAVTVIAWFAILFTGRYPRGLFQFTVGVQRWYWRTMGYFASFNDRFPPYGLSAEDGPASNGATVANGIIGGLVAAGYAAIFVTAAAVGDNPVTADNLDYDRVVNGQQQPSHRFREDFGTEEVLLRLTRAVDPGESLAEIIRPAPGERMIVFQWTVVNGTGSGALVERDAARVKVEYTEDGDRKTSTFSAAVIGVNNVTAPANVSAFGTATVQAVFVVPEDAEVLELRFSGGFSGGGVKYVFD